MFVNFWKVKSSAIKGVAVEQDVIKKFAPPHLWIALCESLSQNIVKHCNADTGAVHNVNVMKHLFSVIQIGMYAYIYLSFSSE